MTFTIGRATFSSNPTAASHSGDRLSLTVDISPATTSGSVDHAKALRQQVLGLAGNPDEPVVPVTWSDDPDWDGFYRVVSATVDPFATYLSNGFMRCRIELERIGGGYGSPLHEVVVATGTAGSSHLLWVPSAYVWHGIATATPVTRSTATGGVTGFDLSHANTKTPALYTIEPGDHYDGACLVEVMLSDSLWYPVMGRQVPDGWQRMRIGNGVIRAQIDPTTPSPLFIQVWDGSAWDSIGTFAANGPLWPAGPNSNYGAAFLKGASILSNSPTGASIAADHQTTGRWTISVARGDMYILTRFTDPSVPALPRIGTTLYVGASDTTAATASGTTAIRQTSNGSSGHRWLLNTTAKTGQDLTNGAIALNSNDGLAAIGVILNGSGAASPNTETDIRLQSAARIAQRQNVVSR